MEDRSSQILSVAILFCVLSWISVSLRIYVRAVMLKAFGKDDIAMMVTLAFFTVYISCQLGGVSHGTGKHIEKLTQDDAEIALRFWFFCEIFYTLATSVLKVSIGYFLLRIARVPLHVWIIRAIMISSMAMGLAYCCVVLFQCKPISYWWDLNSDHTGTCLSPSIMTDTTYVISALNSVADWVFGVLPIFIVKDLQMKTSVKVVVATILGFAAIGSAATIVRMPYIWTLKQYKGDFLWRTADVAIWTTVEVGVGITAGCLATLKPLMKEIMIFVGMESNSSPSDLPWSTKRGPTKPGFTIEDQPLDTLGPMAVTTTVTGRGKHMGKGLTSWADRTQRDSEEDIIPESYAENDMLNLKAWKGGISKSVQVTTVEERNTTKSAGSSSMSGDTDDDKPFPNKAAVIYERL